ncbi:MAG TPA: glutaredoxin [Hydrogenophaga sp.]|nr:glutaredoxin [Hydrogenophaga sp.]
MTRPVLDATSLHPAIRDKVANLHRDLLDQVQTAVAHHAVVVIGMSGNPFVAKARKTLARAEVPFQYLAFGSYISQWRRRNALKMWTGWPTLPMVFVRGMLVGGADDLSRLMATGELKELLAK